ncbi:MAG: RHS repeat-associated core domain-containing protein, partial [Pedobacter sp.]
YTGREWDKETGLYYYRARTYDPVAGRFLQRDPISFAGGNVNLYGYVQNNPVNWIDPDGTARKPGQTPPKRWPKPPKSLKPKWNKEGVYDCANGRRLSWDDRSHGAGVDRGDGPQGGHWDDENSDNRWDESGNLLPGSPDSRMDDTYVGPTIPFFPINPTIPALPGFSPVPIRVPIPVFGF